MKKLIFIATVILCLIMAGTMLVACNGNDDSGKQFTITFDSNGGSELQPITVKEGGKIILPADPAEAPLFPPRS